MRMRRGAGLARRRRAPSVGNGEQLSTFDGPDAVWCADLPVQRVFEDAFREYGLPDVIRTDNGPPFASVTVGGLSRLAVWWIQLGIHPERILPGHPEQNGRHERMDRTSRAETARPPRRTFAAQQRSFDDSVHDDNCERPHEALGQVTPSELYKRSRRPCAHELEDPEYARHFETRRAYPNGVIKASRYAAERAPQKPPVRASDPNARRLVGDHA